MIIMLAVDHTGGPRRPAGRMRPSSADLARLGWEAQTPRPRPTDRPTDRQWHRRLPTATEGVS